MEHGKSRRHAVLLAAALLISAAAQVQAEGVAGRLIERLHRPALPTAEAAADTTPPTLTLFDAGTTWSMNRGAAPLSVAVKATDDLSGLSHSLYEVILVDHAGNARTLLNTAFGGSTDFSALMVNTTIKLTP